MLREINIGLATIGLAGVMVIESLRGGTETLVVNADNSLSFNDAIATIAAHPTLDGLSFPLTVNPFLTQYAKKEGGYYYTYNAPSLTPTAVASRTATLTVRGLYDGMGSTYVDGTPTVTKTAVTGR
jgi:hypothetical protein